MMFSNNEVSLSAGQGDDASATESVPVQMEGEDITVAFNPSYLSEGLNVIGGPYTRFAFTSAPKPALLTGKKNSKARRMRTTGIWSCRSAFPTSRVPFP